LSTVCLTHIFITIAMLSYDGWPEPGPYTWPEPVQSEADRIIRHLNRTYERGEDKALVTWVDSVLTNFVSRDQFNLLAISVHSCVSHYFNDMDEVMFWL
jgi:hypothetical protein